MLYPSEGLCSVFKKLWEDLKWFFIGALWITVFVLGYIGTRKHFALSGDVRSFFDPIYRAFQLFMLDDSMILLEPGPGLPWEFELARFLMPFVAAGTVFMAVISVFRKEIKKIQLKCLKNHVVVCGLGRKGLLLAKGFRDQGYKVVIIEQDDNNPFAEQCEDFGAFLLYGDATYLEMLKKARVHKAKYVVTITGDDGTNAEIAVRSWELVRNDSSRIQTCFAHITNPELCALLRERELMSEMVDNFRLEFFNIFDAAAKALVEKYPPFDNQTGDTPHVLIVGLGRMGESVTLQVVHRWWKEYKKSKTPIRVSLIDREAETKVLKLKLRYPQFFDASDVRTYNIDLDSPEFTPLAFLSDASSLTAVYVCLDNDSKSLASGLALLQGLSNQFIRIVVRMVHDAGLAALLLCEEARSSSKYSRLYAFGMLDCVCQPDRLIGGTHETLAIAIHNEYLLQQKETGLSAEINPSLVPWHKLTEDLRESCRRQADHLGKKLATIGYNIEPLRDWNAEFFEFTDPEINKLAKMEHERFVKERLESGWTYSFGPKDLKKRTNPALISWDHPDLDDKERDKTLNMVKKIPVFLARAGFQLHIV